MLHTNIRAAAVIIRDDQILLIKRVKTDREYYVFPDGQSSDGESAEIALKRDLLNELKIDITPKEELFYFTNDYNNHTRVEHYFLVDEFNGTPEIAEYKQDKTEPSGQYLLKWVKLSEIKNLPILPDVAKNNIIAKFCQ